MGDPSDAFFNSFDNVPRPSTGTAAQAPAVGRGQRQQQQQQQRPMGSYQQRSGPPPPAGGRGGTTSTSLRRPTAPPPPGAVTTTAAPSIRPTPPAQPKQQQQQQQQQQQFYSSAPQGYGGNAQQQQQQQQQGQQQSAASYYNYGQAQVSTPANVTAASTNDDFDSDWYSPSTTTTTQQPSMFQPQQQQVPQNVPAVSGTTQPLQQYGYGQQQHQQQQYTQQASYSTATNSALDGSGRGRNQQTRVPTGPFATPMAVLPPAGGGGGQYGMSNVTNNNISMITPTIMTQPSLPGIIMDGGMMSSSSVQQMQPLTGSHNDLDDYSNEPPLLEELGINIEHIIMKTKAVVIPFRRFAGKNSALLDPSIIIDDADLAGPLVFALLLGGELMLVGKFQFGYIYGFGMFGCLSITIVLNLMTPADTGAISFWTVASILGYSLLPVNLLAAIKILLVNLAGFTKLTQFLALLTVLWSTTASTRLLEVGCRMEAQRYLLAYPLALIYSAFVLITLF